MEKKIDAFIERLSAEQVRNLAENIYENEAQRENLRLYLKFLCKNNPTYMWVDEAPGYKGCGITGIPFTDEGEMKNNLETSQNGYFFMDENNPQKKFCGNYLASNPSKRWKSDPVIMECLSISSI